MSRQLKTIMASTFKIKCYKLEKNEKIRLEQIQTQALVNQNREIMNQMLIKEASKHRDTIEGQMVYNQMRDEVKVLKNHSEWQGGHTFQTDGENREQVSVVQHGKAKFSQVGRVKVKPDDYARVTMSGTTNLLKVNTNFNWRNPEANDAHLEIHTIDSDFMIKIWDISFEAA